MTRRSVRKYKDTPLSDELLMKILEPALAAPSGVNLQNWYLVVVRTPEAMEDLKELMFQAAMQNRPALEARFVKNPEVAREAVGFIGTLGGAPACVLAFQLKESFNGDLRAVQSVSAAIENLLLSAWNEGVASCWMAPKLSEELKEKFQARFAPGKGEFVAAISLGYPDQAPKMPVRREGRYTFV